MFRIIKTPTTTCWSARINRSQLKLNQRILLECQTASWLKSRPTSEFPNLAAKKLERIGHPQKKPTWIRKCFPSLPFLVRGIVDFRKFEIDPECERDGETADRKWERLHTTPQRVAMPKIIKASPVGFPTKKKTRKIITWVQNILRDGFMNARDVNNGEFPGTYNTHAICLYDLWSLLNKKNKWITWFAMSITINRTSVNVNLLSLIEGK